MICDDGNNMNGSIYNSARIIDAVDTRLQTNAELRLLCLFCSDDDTKFTERFSGHPQVDMRRGPPPAASRRALQDHRSRATGLRVSTSAGGH